MPNMSLGSPLGGGGMVYRGPLFVPGAQAAGSTQTGRATSLAELGYGVTASNQTTGPRTAHYGSVGATIVAAVLLTAIYFSLPR